MHQPVIVARRTVGQAREQLLGIESQQDMAYVQKIQGNIVGARPPGPAGESQILSGGQIDLKAGLCRSVFLALLCQRRTAETMGNEITIVWRNPESADGARDEIETAQQNLIDDEGHEISRGVRCMDFLRVPSCPSWLMVSQTHPDCMSVDLEGPQA